MGSLGVGMDGDKGERRAKIRELVDEVRECMSSHLMVSCVCEFGVLLFSLAVLSVSNCSDVVLCPRNLVPLSIPAAMISLSLTHRHVTTPSPPQVRNRAPKEDILTTASKISAKWSGKGLAL
jgi:hypothetical protein